MGSTRVKVKFEERSSVSSGLLMLVEDSLAASRCGIAHEEVRPGHWVGPDDV